MPNNLSPIGKVVLSTPQEVTFHLHPDTNVSNLTEGTPVQTNSTDPATGARASTTGKVTRVQERYASFRIFHTKVQSHWSPSQPVPPPDSCVYLAPKQSRKPRRQTATSRPPRIVVKLPEVLTCPTCDTVTNSLSPHPEEKVQILQETLTCPNCHKSTTVTNPNAPNPPDLYNGPIKCRRTKHPLATLLQVETNKTFYACLYCATRRIKRRIPPFLLTDKTQGLITEVATSTALNNIHILLDPELAAPPNDPRPFTKLTAFLLAQVNHRKQALLAVAERPASAYRHILPSMDLLLQHQYNLESTYLLLTGEPPDPTQYPEWDDRHLTNLLNSLVVQQVHVANRQAVIHHTTPMFTNQSQETPSPQQAINLIELI